MAEPKQFAMELKKRLEELSKAQKIGQKVGLITSEPAKTNENTRRS